jgi:hypothetical protein
LLAPDAPPVAAEESIAMSNDVAIRNMTRSEVDGRVGRGLESRPDVPGWYRVAH